MFGFVTAGWKELDQEQQRRYSAVYCGICRAMGQRCSHISRLCLSYDMAFLALLNMSLYEPGETAGSSCCAAHPFRTTKWIENRCIQYAADMNVLLAYWKAEDDVHDENRRSAAWLASRLEPSLAQLSGQWPRQCSAVESCLKKLSGLEQANSPDPDAAASCFGSLMAELMVMDEDIWSEQLRLLGIHLGRYIYLADAMIDYDRDAKKGSYNPFLAAGISKDLPQWEQYLVLEMAQCAQAYEKLPLVQDKALLDNILYSGVWIRWRSYRKKEDRHGSGSV